MSVEDRQLIRQLIVEKTPEQERKHFLTLVQPISTASPIIPTPIRPNLYQFGQTPSMFIGQTTHPPMKTPPILPPPPPLTQDKKPLQIPKKPQLPNDKSKSNESIITPR